ncbi:sigma-70 family RNA polymerase sigma factor [Cereibacter sphaeroides]|uniref:sigma-70 family RNA polymerase sigma factor n=1 Tax=Cereibacter sphaeroides TaxID=1063 RepID=UPI001F47FDDE|nr:sigma-70 family RNA polymerase sigma factor [Cereibacter sphaeroides]MCE6959185.1 sigma-70 family RNA polymerase sigma factor [Cereibacter sphaeroides]MCE6974154.1 sigma-70 family RNA polymerase sigma factor [Cereibacter sphaeroides]
MRETDDILSELTPLRRYARSLTRDAADAEDLVQEALLRAHERRASFRRGAGLRVWLLSILHNLFIDGLRSRRARERREAAAGELLPSVVQAPQEMAVRLAQIREAFNRLPEEQRSALHLVAIEGLSYSEAAAVLGVPQGTLMSRIGRARAALRAFEEGEAPARHSLRIVGGRDADDA